MQKLTMILTVNKKRYESPLTEVVALQMEAILNNASDTTPFATSTPEEEEIP